MHCVGQVAGGIDAHSMSRSLKLICSMSVTLFLFSEILFSDSSFHHFEHSRFFPLFFLPLIPHYLVQCSGCDSEISSGHGVVFRHEKKHDLCCI